MTSWTSRAARPGLATAAAARQQISGGHAEFMALTDKPSPAAMHLGAQSHRWLAACACQCQALPHATMPCNACWTAANFTPSPAAGEDDSTDGTHPHHPAASCDSFSCDHSVARLKQQGCQADDHALT